MGFCVLQADMMSVPWRRMDELTAIAMAKRVRQAVSAVREVGG